MVECIDLCLLQHFIPLCSHDRLRRLQCEPVAPPEMSRTWTRCSPPLGWHQSQVCWFSFYLLSTLTVLKVLLKDNIEAEAYPYSISFLLFNNYSFRIILSLRLPHLFRSSASYCVSSLYLVSIQHTSEHTYCNMLGHHMPRVIALKLENILSLA